MPKSNLTIGLNEFFFQNERPAVISLIDSFINYGLADDALYPMYLMVSDSKIRSNAFIFWCVIREMHLELS